MIVLPCKFNPEIPMHPAQACFEAVELVRTTETEQVFQRVRYYAMKSKFANVVGKDGILILDRGPEMVVPIIGIANG
jgi:hypothetical protein